MVTSNNVICHPQVNKEGWENIMSSAKGPTTFNADYSVRVAGK